MDNPRSHKPAPSVAAICLLLAACGSSGIVAADDDSVRNDPPSVDAGADQAVGSADYACGTDVGTTGLMVNGTATDSRSDGTSYGPGVWHILPPAAERYDVDICGGRAPQGEHHRHFYTPCLADLVGEGSEHLPVFGFAADGHPANGPYESAGTVAISGWTIRDYGAATSAGGCGTPGERACTLVDPYDIALGVDTTVTQGPDIGETVTTLSGNTHTVGDGAGNLTPSFPYTVEPRFYGELPDNAVTACGGNGGGMGPPR